MRILSNSVIWLAMLSILPFHTSIAQQPFWQHVNGPYGGRVVALAVDKAGIIYAGTDYAGVFRSTDHGNTWVSVLPGKFVQAICIDSSGRIFAGGSGIDGGLYRSTDEGQTWSTIQHPNPGGAWNVQSLLSDKKGHIFLGQNGGGVWKSTDQGSTWNEVETSSGVFSLALGPSDELLAGLSNGVARSTDGGLTWSSLTAGLPVSIIWALTTAVNGTILAGTQQGIYESSDSGRTWKYALPSNWVTGINVMCLTTTNQGLIYAGAETYGIIKSTDNGLSWVQVLNGLHQSSFYSIANDSQGVVFTGSTGDGVFRSTNGGQLWTNQKEGMTAAWIQCAARVGANLYVGTNGGVFQTSDDGKTWVQDTAGLTFPYVLSLTVTSQGSILAGTSANPNYPSGIYRSTDEGASWQVIDGMRYNISSLIADSSGRIFAGSEQNGVFISNDDGLTWYADSALNTPYAGNLTEDARGELFVSNADGLFRSTEQGEVWERLGQTASGDTVPGVIASSNDGTLYGVCGDTGPSGIVRSTDDGRSWQSAGLSNFGANYVFVDPSGTIYAFVTTRHYPNNISSMVSESYTSRDDGTTWTLDDSSYIDRDVVSVLVSSNGHLFLGTYAGLFQSAQAVTPVLSPPSLIPSTFILAQNYPNPFNPSTSIAYDLPVNSRVTLNVYDILGREVETLVNEQQSAGEHSVIFNANDLASGVYFYRIQAGPYHDVKKLLVLK